MDAFSHLPNSQQSLRLLIDDQPYQGQIVSMTDETMMVATSLKERLDVSPGTVVEGEVPQSDGLYHFISRVVGSQLMPTLVFLLERPRSMRRIQRRDHDRYPVTLQAQLIFISLEFSLNTPARVTDMSVGGMGLWAADAPPVGYHCIVLVDLGGVQVSTICTVIHATLEAQGVRVGLAFTEMSRDDRRTLRAFVTKLEEASGEAR